MKQAIYNIWPTVFYYARPLRDPIDQSRAMVVAEQITDRVNNLEGDAVSWLKNFSKHLGLHPKSIEISKNDPRLITVRLKSAAGA